MPDSYSRRHFLKLSAALLAGGAAIAAAPDARGMGFSGVPDVGPVDRDERVLSVLPACTDCP